MSPPANSGYWSANFLDSVTMSEAAIHDYLTKQIIINHNIITFRLLSRAVSIHVNAAKSALASFYETTKASSSDSALHATYLISGDAIETTKREDSMDVDDIPVDLPSPLAETVPKQKMMVIPEEKLEAAKSLFKSIRATHIYSIEPSKFMDPSLLVTTVDAVRKVDATKSADDLRKLGIPVSKACKYNANIKTKGKAAAPAQSKASTSKEATKNMKAPAVPKRPSVEKVKLEAKPDPPVKKEAPKETLARKPSGTTKSGGLDWGKAKSKEVTKPIPEKAKSQSKIATSTAQSKRVSTERAPSVSSSTTSDPKPKRGIKRPTPPSNDEEDEDMKPPKAKARMSAPSKVDSIRTKRGVVLSDDEEEEELPVKSVRRKIKSDATMDWSDDDNVVAAPRHIPGPPSSREDGTENEDDDEEPEQSSLGEDPMEMSDDAIEEPKYAKAARATKKSKKCPVGANGLRKRRILQTREYTDARGFLQMEDYSEYESVNSESEQPPDPVAKSKKAPKEVKAKAEPVEKKAPAAKVAKQSSFKESAAPKPKPKTATGGTKKKTLDSFFSKK